MVPECACGPTIKEVPMGIAKQLFLMTVQWSRKYSLAITVILALVSIGVGYLQTRDPSTADFESSAEMLE